MAPIDKVSGPGQGLSGTTQSGPSVPSFGDIKMDRNTVLPSFDEPVRVAESKPSEATLPVAPASPVTIIQDKPPAKPLGETRFAITSGPPQGDP